MSVTLSCTQVFEATLADGTKLKIGDLYTPNTVSLTSGTKYETIATILDDYGSAALWSKDDGGMATWEVALIYSDADIFIDLKTDMATDEFVMLELQGGVWHMLTSDDVAGYDTATRIDGAVLVEATDYAQCDEIVAYRDAADDAGDAQVHLILLG